jgi:hypothetical protein
VGGVVWAATVIAVVAILGLKPTVPLPSPPIAFLPWGFIPSCLVAVVAWLVSRRKRELQLHSR